MMIISVYIVLIIVTIVRW